MFEDRALASYIKAWFDSTLTDYGNSESFEEFMMRHILMTLLIIKIVSRVAIMTLL